MILITCFTARSCPLWLGSPYPPSRRVQVQAFRQAVLRVSMSLRSGLSNDQTIRALTLSPSLYHHEQGMGGQLLGHYYIIRWLGHCHLFQGCI